MVPKWARLKAMANYEAARVMNKHIKAVAPIALGYQHWRPAFVLFDYCRTHSSIKDEGNSERVVKDFGDLASTLLILHAAPTKPTGFGSSGTRYYGRVAISNSQSSS